MARARTEPSIAITAGAASTAPAMALATSVGARAVVVGLLTLLLVALNPLLLSEQQLAGSSLRCRWLDVVGRLQPPRDLLN